MSTNVEHIYYKTVFPGKEKNHSIFNDYPKPRGTDLLLQYLNPVKSRSTPQFRYSKGPLA